MDWTIGTWKGVRRAADGGDAPMSVRVEALPHGSGQVEYLRVEGGTQAYTGFTIRSFDAASGEWMMVYANSAQRPFARLRGAVKEAISTWESISSDSARKSRLVSERLSPDRWRKTQNISEDGGKTWRVLFTDELERAPEGRVAQAQAERRAPNHRFPQWSHDGRKIVFTSDRDGDPEIYVMNSDGSNPVRLTQAPGRDAHPYFSRDGRRILFQSPRANGVDTNIYQMNADGSQVAQLTRLKGFAGVPVFSPDERLIAFQWRESNDFNDERKWRICVMNADGSGFRVITSGAANDQVPNFSRDSKRLIFYSDRTGRNQIYTMRTDGGDVRPIAATASNDNAAFWSPDNTKIAFTSDRDGNSEIYVMDADGKNARRLTHTRATERAAVWSPDGRRLVFSSDGDGPSQVYVMNADGSNLSCLTENLK